jgi:hypothetical protein
MVTCLGIRLLELTKQKLRVSLEDLRAETGNENLDAELRSLNERRLVNLNHTFLELGSHQRVMIAEDLVRTGRDVQQVSCLLGWQEFEEFVETALDQSGFRSVRHLVFKSRVGKREIDVLAWSNLWILTVDCKHWARALVRSRMKNAAEAQVERTRALAERPEVMQKHGVPRIDLPLVPVILTLGEPRDKIIGGVPVVSVSKFSSFLQEASPYTDGILTVQVQNWSKQSSLLRHIDPRILNRTPNLAQNAERRQP